MSPVTDSCDYLARWRRLANKARLSAQYVLNEHRPVHAAKPQECCCKGSMNVVLTNVVLASIESEIEDQQTS